MNKSNARVVQENMCVSAQIAQQVIPNWEGQFVLIGYSYGGLRARAYVETNNLYPKNGTLCGFFSSESEGMSMRFIVTTSFPDITPSNLTICLFLPFFKVHWGGR